MHGSYLCGIYRLELDYIQIEIVIYCTIGSSKLWIYYFDYLKHVSFLFFFCQTEILLKACFTMVKATLFSLNS